MRYNKIKIILPSTATIPNTSATIPSIAYSRSFRHSALNATVEEMAEEADLHVHHEPPTHLVLQGQFSREECRALFRKNPNAQQRARVADVLELQRQMRLLEPGEPHRRINAHVQGLLTSLRPDPHDGSGLRFDSMIEDPYTEQVLLTDATCAHSTTYTSLKDEWPATFAAIDSFRSGTFPCAEPNLPCARG